MCIRDRAQDVTKTDTDRSNYSVEFVQLQNYMSDIGIKDFNGISLFNDYHEVVNNNLEAVGKEVTIDSDGTKVELDAINYNSQSDADGSNNQFWVSSQGVRSVYNGLNENITLDNTTSAASALSWIQTSIQNLADLRASVGSNIQRLKFSTDQVGILNEKLSAANSRIKDVDVAEEATEYARNNILLQSGTSMLGQANMLPSMALQLLG